MEQKPLDLIKMNQYIKQSLQIILFIIIGFLVIEIIKLNAEKNSINRVTKNQIQNLQERSNKIVKDKEQQIDYLIKRNALTELEIKKKQKSIDSLENRKKQIQVIYIDNVKEINGFNAKQLENYFRNEIK